MSAARELFLGIDVGTQSTKAVLVDVDPPGSDALGLASMGAVEVRGAVESGLGAARVRPEIRAASGVSVPGPWLVTRPPSTTTNSSATGTGNAC